MGKSNVLGAFEDLRKEVQVLDEKEKDQILRYKIMQPASEIQSNKPMLEQLVAIKLQ